MHLTLEKAFSLTLSLSICVLIGVPLINLALNSIRQGENYQNACLLLNQIDYGAKQAIEEDVVYFNKVIIPVNLTLWSFNETVYCKYGEGEDCILKQTFPLTVDLTPPNGVGEFLLTVFCDHDILIIKFSEA